jgi:hypothetical protein
LTGVLNVVGIINDGWFDIFPVVALFVESVGFVSDTSGFETAVLQVVATPRMNVESEGQGLGEFARLHYVMVGFEVY